MIPSTEQVRNMSRRSRHYRLLVFALFLCACVPLWIEVPARAADLTLRVGGDLAIRAVGAVRRWDQDGNPTREVDPKAKIDAPVFDATGEKSGNVWVLRNLKPGRYDLILLGEGRVRIDGFDFAPVLEFDPFFKGDSQVDEDARAWVEEDIRASRHYENKVEPLYFGGDEKTIRVLVMLIRDLPTSYEGDFPGAATIRHEIWQYSWAYGGWKKEKRTRVLDRCILHRDELRQWTWLWDPGLGGIEIGKESVEIEYRLPDLRTKSLKGLYPY
ncbi:hypothetical protein [Thermopirellula anaerolimosa]